MGNSAFRISGQFHFDRYGFGSLQSKHRPGRRGMNFRVRRGGSEFGIFPRNSTLPMFILRSKKGNLLLFERKKKGQPKETEGPLFLLRRSFHHRPRPWWITEAEAEAATREFIEDNF